MQEVVIWKALFYHICNTTAILNEENKINGEKEFHLKVG